MTMARQWVWTPVGLLHLITLTVSVLSYLNESSDNTATFLTATIGDHVVFNCPIDFPHDNEIPYRLRWNKEGKNVFSWFEGAFTAADNAYAGRVNLVARETNYGRGSVNLTNIRESDSGWYECTVFFPNRKPNTRPNGTWFHLNVDGGTLLAIPPINVTTLERSPAHFPCITKDHTATVTWYKDGVPIAEMPELSSRSSVNREGSLTISSTDMGDTGELHCVVTSEDGQRQTAGAFLNVQYKAKVVYSPHDVYLQYGQSGILDCHFRANPPLTNLRWEKDGYLFDPYNVRGVFYKSNGSLHFSEVEEDHRGRYTCTPFNELGTEGASAVMIVNVQRPPVFTITPHNMYMRKIGDSLDMPCDAVDGDSNRRPTIVWFRKDGLPLPPNRTRIHNGNLTIDRVEADDRGLYQCVASNEAATISSDTELRIDNVAPRALYNLTATATTTSVRLQWLPGFIRPNMEYSVWYRAADTPEWRTARIATPRSATEVTLTGLSPGRMYDLMVLTQDAQGDGLFSKVLRVKTLQGSVETSSQAPAPEDVAAVYTHLKSPLSAFQQIGPPRNVQANLTLDGYVIYWEPPEFGLDELRVYRVQWAAGPDEHYTGSAETTETYILVADLEEDHAYYFHVSAVARNRYEAPGAQFVLRVPVFRNARTLAVALGAGVAFLLVVAAGAVYVRRMQRARRAEIKA